jgi:CsoR family transcriptional regulator, copper-sensing transcriptional repressor
MAYQPLAGLVPFLEFLHTQLTTGHESRNISPIGGYMAYKPKDTRERIIHRLKIARGHLDKVIKMMEEDAYCIDVMHQMQAIESGLKETGNLLLENHLKSCVADAIRQGKADESIAEIMQVFKKK